MTEKSGFPFIVLGIKNRKKRRKGRFVSTCWSCNSCTDNLRQVLHIFTSQHKYTSSLYLHHDTPPSTGMSCKEQYMSHMTLDISVCCCFLDMLFPCNGNRNGRLFTCVVLRGPCGNVWNPVHLYQ
jgi:hypothetical protein